MFFPFYTLLTSHTSPKNLLAQLVALLYSYSMKSLANAIKFDNLIKALGELTPEEKLVSAYNSVRDIPYGGVRTKDTDDVLADNKGTGRGKHALLKNLFESMGYEVKEYLAMHNLSEYPLNPWPSELDAFKGKKITSFHEFLKIKLQDKWVTVDAAFDHSLVPLGFPQLEWDGKSDMALPVNAEQILDVGPDATTQIKELIRTLPEEERQLRQSFLKTLKAWIEKNRQTQEEELSA